MTDTRYLIPSSGQPRGRRAMDATGMALALVVFLVALWAWSRVDDVEIAVSLILDSVPDWLSGTTSFVYGLCVLYTVLLIIGVGVKWRTATGALRDIVLALVAAGLLGTVLARLITDEWPRMLPELGLAEPLAQFPILRVTIVTAVLLVAAPHFTRPVRRTGWVVILLTAASGVLLGFGLPSSGIGAMALGAAAAESVLLVFGSPRGHPVPASIETSLNNLGVRVSNVRLNLDQSWGVRRLVGDGDNGRVEIKAYGRDAEDSQFFTRAWKYLWYRDAESVLALTRVQNVEHEALVTVMAARTEASATHLLAAGIGEDNVAILAVEAWGKPLESTDTATISDADLAALWKSLAHLHAAAISHGGLSAKTILLSDGGHQIRDFGFGSLGASDSLTARDVVELLFVLSELVGVERAVATARTGLGDEALRSTMPYIQVPAVSSYNKSWSTEKPKTVITNIRAQLEQVLSIKHEDEGDLVELRRVSGRSLISTGLFFLAAYFLITQLAGIDFEAVWEVARTAEWGLIVLAFLVGQLVYFPQATAMLAAVGYPIPLKPAVLLQSATMFLSLAVPSSAGRITATAVFLKKYGIGFTTAVVQGSIDTLAGLLVEVTVLLLAFLFGALSLDLDTSGVNWGLVVLLIALVGLVVVYLVRHVQKLRDWVLPILSQAWSALAGVLKDPKRTITLLASESGSRLVLGISLWLILQSVGVPLSVFEATTTVIAAGLLGGLIPVPGGVGVTEAVLTGFLVMFGVDQTSAFAAAVIYRVATFYIPSGAGYFSTKWLQSNGYV